MDNREAYKELRELYDIAKRKKDVSQALKIYHMMMKLGRKINNKTFSAEPIHYRHSDWNVCACFAMWWGSDSFVHPQLTDRSIEVTCKDCLEQMKRWNI